MQKNKNTHQDNYKKEDIRTTPSERTHFLIFNSDHISIFFGKTTFNLTGTFNNNKQTGNSMEKDKCRILSKDTV
jgi:hypothetical protein